MLKPLVLLVSALAISQPFASGAGTSSTTGLEAARKADSAAAQGVQAAEANLASARATKAATAEAVAADEAAPPPEPEPVAVDWYGDLSGGTINSSIYPASSFVAGHVSVVPDPLGSGRNVLRYAIDDSDRPYSGATNPRGDVEGPPLFKPGSDDYITISTLLPASFPLVNKGWFMASELYGPPHGGSPPIGEYIYDIGGGNRIILQNRGGTPFWESPIVDAKWHTLTEHVHFATDSTGSLEVFYDGQPTKMLSGASKINYPNLVSTVNWDGTHPNYVNINSYRQASAFGGTVTLYHGAPTVATTLAASLSKPVP